MTNNNLSEPGNLVQVLISSFRLLSGQPKLFIPKIFSTGLSAIWFIGIVSGSGNPVLYISLLPVLVMLGVAVSIMLAGMVKNQESDKILVRGLEAIKINLRSIIGLSVLMLVTTFIISLPLSMGVYLYTATSNMALSLVLIGLSIVLMLVLTFLVYFLPITLIEEGGLLSSIKSSGSASVSNSREVIGLTLLSFVLISVSIATQGSVETAGYIGFFVARLLSAIVTTYLFVVSPKYYLSNN